MSVSDLLCDHFVIIKDTQIAGVTAIGRCNWFSAEIYHTCVLPQFRGQGIATALNEFAIYYARDILAKKLLVCTVRENNEPSKKLVAKIGFTKVASFENNGNLINYYIKQLVVED